MESSKVRYFFFFLQLSDNVPLNLIYTRGNCILYILPGLLFNNNYSGKKAWLELNVYVM